MTDSTSKTETNAGRFYLTTPIYYVNARPHLGHAYSTIVCDAIARRKRALGIETWFLTGTDEHGQKIERSAKAAGCTPEEFATKIAGEFRGLWDRLGITYDDFIRTTEPRHIRGVQKLFATLRDKGYIYKGSYTGQYCVFDEAYVDGPPGTPCPDCGRPTETVSEENYFFKLSAFERKLLEFYDANPEFMGPESTRREVISFVRGGLKDLSVTRTSVSWGIPVPGDEKHVVYVWLDALANYITALGYGSDDRRQKIQEVLAGGYSFNRERNQPVSLRLLAGVSDGGRDCDSAIGAREWVAAVRPGKDVEVAREHCAGGDGAGCAGRGCAAVLFAARDSVWAGREFFF